MNLIGFLVPRQESQSPMSPYISGSLLSPRNPKNNKLSPEDLLAEYKEMTTTTHEIQ